MNTPVLVNVYNNQYFDLDQASVGIGRSSSNKIILKDVLVSRHHAKIVRIGDEYFIEDNGSTNGTTVNDKPIKGRQQLHKGDCLRFGTNWFTFEMECGESTKAPACSAGSQTQTKLKITAIAGFQSLIDRFKGIRAAS